jgi:hypothetical protein
LGAAQINPDDEGGDGAANARDGEWMPIEDFDKEAACTPKHDGGHEQDDSLTAIHGDSGAFQIAARKGLSDLWANS